MAIVNFGLDGESSSNVFDDEIIATFAFEQIAPPSLSGDTLSLTYTFLTTTLTLYSDAGLSFTPPSGVINGFEDEGTFAEQLNVDFASFLANIRDGNTDALNTLFWGGADVITGGDNNDILRGFGGIDNINGGAGNDTLIGDTGADRLYGGTGDDLLLGGSQNDILNGQQGNDRLVGGSGNDRLYGGSGRDDFTGGTGADTFYWQLQGDFAPINNGNLFTVDFIRDFWSAEGDKINLNNLDANLVLGGNQDFTYIGSDPFVENSPGELRVVNIGGPLLWRVELNTDNDASPEFAINVLSYGGMPLAGDFIM